MMTTPQRKKKDPKEDVQAIMRRKTLAKLRFKALARLVMANVYWLAETEETYHGYDVKRRVEQAVRTKKKKQLLNAYDKSLLFKPAEDRTEAEKKYLYRIIGGLKCFRRYQEHVKKKLAAVTYFRYYGPGRVIVRQNHEAHALYFIVTGDVVVCVRIYDEVAQKHVNIEVGQMHPGDMLGEVSLLHNINRTATCSTIGHCEFLMLMKEDFKTVLLTSVQKQWDEIQRAMLSFSYFQGVGEVVLREGCIVSRMKKFEAGQIILGDGIGVPNFVHFVLSGRCRMLETLDVIITVAKDRKFYKLYYQEEPSVEVIEELDFDKKYFDKYKHLKQKKDSSDSSNIDRNSNTRSVRISNTTQESRINSNTDNERQTSDLNDVDTEMKRPSEGASSGKSSKEENNWRTSLVTLDEENKSESAKVVARPSNINTYFMEVCTISAGGCFGLGENMRDRHIVAMERVDIMMMPKMWLMQRNNARVWVQVQRYLEKKIPTKQKLFNEFVKGRQWEEYRTKISDAVIARSSAVNFTTRHDEPYYNRINAIHDI